MYNIINSSTNNHQYPLKLPINHEVSLHGLGLRIGICVQPRAKMEEITTKISAQELAKWINV